MFLGGDRILDPIGEPLVIVMAQNTIPPTSLGGIAHEVHIISGDLIARFHVEIIQHVGHFTNRVQETKIST